MRPGSNLSTPCRWWRSRSPCSSPRPGKEGVTSRRWTRSHPSDPAVHVVADRQRPQAGAPQPHLSTRVKYNRQHGTVRVSIVSPPAWVTGSGSTSTDTGRGIPVERIERTLRAVRPPGRGGNGHRRDRPGTRADETSRGSHGRDHLGVRPSPGAWKLVLGRTRLPADDAAHRERRPLPFVRRDRRDGRHRTTLGRCSTSRTTCRT